MKLPNDNLSFCTTNIRLGSSVAGFFIRQGISRVILEYDYGNKNLEIIGIYPEQRQTYPYPIIEGLSIASVQQLKYKGIFTWMFFITSAAHLNIIDFSKKNLQFKTKVISENKILVENIPMLPILKLSNLLIDMKHLKIISHSTMTNEKKIKLNPLNRCTEKNNTERLIEKMQQKKLTNS